MRLFVALVPPREVRIALANAARSALAGNEGFRAVPEENVHLTVAFLGEREPAWVPGFARACRAGLASRTPLGVSLAGPGSFPGGPGARVLWAGLEPGAALAELHELVVSAAAAAGDEGRRERFVPHMTLARRRGRGPAKVPAAWAELRLEGRWSAGELRLQRSTLDPRGARYETLEIFPFSGAKTRESPDPLP